MGKKAEHAIKTFKGHFKVGVATVDQEFPIAHCDILLTQAVMTLNMLQYLQLNPKISAYTYIFASYDFNTTPIASPGTRVVVNYKPYQRLTWELNGEDGWYMGPSMKHYKCVKCYFPRTNQVCDCGTVTFIPNE